MSVLLIAFSKYLLFLLLLSGLIRAEFGPNPVDSIFGHWNSEPNFDPSKAGGAIDGPILGNGDMGVAVSSKKASNTLTFTIGLNQFWAILDTEKMIPPPQPEPQQPRIMGVGSLSIHIIQPNSPLQFTAQQFISNGSITIEMMQSNTLSYTFNSYIDSTTNLLVINLLNHLNQMTSLSLTTSTLSGFPTRSGCTPQSSNCDDTQIRGDYVTRDSFNTNTFPVTMALVTRVIGTDYTHINSTLTDTSITSILSFTSNALTITALTKTNLDVANVNQSSQLPPKPVIGVDPLLSAQSLSSSLNSSYLSQSRLQTTADWQQYWNEGCIVYLPDTEQLQSYYYGAQYVLAASTKLGKVAPGLWGPWVFNDNANWHGDYTLNYNHESPFYGTYSSNHLDQALASYTPLLHYLPQARINAVYLNCSSPHCIHFPVHLAPYGHSGSLGSQGLLRQHFIASFALMNLITHCSYLDDLNYCTNVYQLFKGITEWWQFYLVKESTSNGSYRFVDPDDCTNEYCGSEGPFNGIIPLALITHIFNWMIQMSITWNIDGDLRIQWEDLVSHLSSLPLADFHGSPIFSYAESNSSNSTPNPNDNPLAVYPIWPAELVSIHSPANLTTIAFNTISYYTGGWMEGNALPIFHPAAIRVGYPVNLVMSGWSTRLDSCLQANLYCAQGGGGIETSGATMGVNEMLMQDNEWAINLFPVWSHNYSAEFQGMRARGGILVSAKYDKLLGKITNIQLNKENSQQTQIRLMHPWQFTQLQKQQHAEHKLYGESMAAKESSVSADLEDVVVYQQLTNGEQQQPMRIQVKRYNGVPVSGLKFGVEYDTTQSIVWFEWEACGGCSYSVMEKEIKVKEELQKVRILSSAV